jgi:hypothetical protein
MESNKVCAMCRKVVDRAAVICPHCRSEINYQYFLELADGNVIKKRSPLVKAVSILVIVVLAGVAALVGLAFGGVWLGLFVFVATLGLISDKMVVGGQDKALIACNGCSHEELYSWNAGSLMAGKRAAFECASCKQKTLIAIQ